MWYLENKGGEIIYLKLSTSMTVSRKEGYDIVLSNDASISKNHAILTVTSKTAFKRSEPSSSVTVKDAGSKYGTFIIIDGRPKKLSSTEYELKASDQIKFGLQQHIFTVHYIPLILATSTLTTGEKAELQGIADIIDAVIIADWKPYCTHLTVSNVTLTAKVVYALASGTPIISAQYWKAVLQHFQNNERLPDIENYTPLIEERLINCESVSLSVNPKRQTLFKNLLFICFSELQYNQMQFVKFAGGKLKLYEKNALKMKQLCADNVIVLQPSSDYSQQVELSEISYDFIQQTLRENRLRTIPESEISLAILHCSIEKYCNPKFQFEKLLTKSNKSMDIANSTLKAPETEEITFTSKRPSKIIHETLSQCDDSETQESTRINSVFSNFTSKNVDGTKKNISQSSSEETENFFGKKRTRAESPDMDSSVSVHASMLCGSDELGQKKNLKSDRSITKKAKLSVSSLDKRPTKLIPESAEIVEVDLIDDVELQSSKDKTLPSLHPVEKRKRPIHDGSSIPKASSSHKPTESVASSSAKDTSTRKPTTYHDSSDDDMFSFVDDKPKKSKKSINEDDHLFSLLEDPNIKADDDDKDMFCISNKHKVRTKRPRSPDSSDDDFKVKTEPVIKVESPKDDENNWTGLRQCKQEISVDDCDMTIIKPLFRTDVQIDLNNTLDVKTFVKIYNLVPTERITTKDMYVWESDSTYNMLDLIAKDSNSEDEYDDDFSFASNKAVKSIRVRR